MTVASNWYLRVSIWMTIIVTESVAAAASGRGIDTGTHAAAMAAWQWTQPLSKPVWFRLRGIVDPRYSGGRFTVATTRDGLSSLRQSGHRICVLLRWGANDWPAGPTPVTPTDMRTGEDGSTLTGRAARAHLPWDLRQAYDRCFRLSVAYRGLVDAWEIDNEPDLGFVPENAEHYAAFLKASYLGFKAGTAKPDQSPENSFVHGQSPLVVMASMGLPPGTWFERFATNDGLSYTDAFNFHYYGYADDFTAVYRAFDDAVTESFHLSAFSSQFLVASPNIAYGERLATSSLGAQRPALDTQRKDLPIFATEIGYGMLGMRERDTKAARLRQWRWFKSVGEQTVNLGMEAPMAFYLQRYHEATGIEFGLTVPHTSPKRYDPYACVGWFAGDNYYTSSDFGAKTAQAWMREIGRPIAGGDVTPALAWWLGHDFANRSKREWRLAVAASSPIVIDLIARENVYGEHRYNGYFVRGTGEEASGPIDLVLYNFSERPVKGSLRLPAFLQGTSTDTIELAPMERRVIRATVKVSSQRFTAQEARIEFLSTDVPTARFVTQFYPQFEGRSVAQELRLTESRVAHSPFALSEASRLRATEEAPKRRDGACWVQQGAQVKWTADGFTVTITDRQPNKERRIEVEIPWPADWNFGPDQFLKTEYRAAKLAPRSNDWPAHDDFMLQVRTENGNLYGVVPMRPMRENWGAFWEPFQNFTLWFYGRANSPWEFRKNRPMSLVLVFYPVSLPVTYEFRRPALVSLAASR